MENGLHPEIIHYLKNPPNVEELRELARKLDVNAEEMVRKGEAEYKDKFKGKSLKQEEWLEVLAKHPKLLERPIVVHGEKAIIGRPPQNVTKLLL